MSKFDEGDQVRDALDSLQVGTVVGVSDFGDVMVDWGLGTEVVPEEWLQHIEEAE